MINGAILILIKSISLFVMAMSTGVPHKGYTYLNLLDSPELLQILMTLITVIKPLLPNLPSIFRDNNVISAIPSYFENTESPIICYKYSKPIRNTILNFNKLVSDLDIETSSPDS